MASKEEEDMEEFKREEAVGGISKAEMELLHSIRRLGFEPRAGSMEDIARLTQVFTESRTLPRRMPEPAPHTEPHKYPKLSIFYGEDGRGEVNWDTFHYEVMAVITSNNFSDDQIMFGIRRAVKGSASDKLRRLGPDVTVREILRKFENDYGTIETTESIMKRFYTCEQKHNESVELFASRLEEVFDKAVELRGLRRTDTGILKQVLHSGLRRDLKLMSAYQCDKESTYDEFKRELRRLEAELKETIPDKPCKPVVPTEKKEEESEIKQLLKQINDRIDKLEKGQSQASQPSNTSKKRNRKRNWNSNFNKQDPNKKSDPKAEDTFSPTCFLCNQKGHVQIKCPIILAQLVCSKCKGKGHSPRDCPN